MRGVGVPGSATPGEVALAPASLGVIGLGESRLYLSASPGFPPLPIDWRQVGEEAESACLWTASAERLLHDTLVLVD
jgi:hypothetical protein